MKRALSIALLGALLIGLALIYADGAYPWSAGNFFTSDAERDRARAERLRDKAAYLEAQARARLQTERLEGDAELRRLFIKQVEEKDRLLEKYAFHMGLARQKSSWWATAAAVLGGVACVLFVLARRLSKRASMAEATVDEIHNRLSALEHSGVISADIVYKIATGKRRLVAMR